MTYAVIGPSEGVAAFEEWSRAMQRPASFLGGKPRLWPTFPGFEAAFAAEWVATPVWKHVLDRTTVVDASREQDPCGVFKAGGDLAFHHGGPSLQELLVPVVTIRMKVRDSERPSASTMTVSGLPDAVTNRIFSVTLQLGGSNLSLFSSPTLVRPLLMSSGKQVGAVGMAALQPGASASFSVVEHGGKLGARIAQGSNPGEADAGIRTVHCGSAVVPLGAASSARSPRSGAEDGR